MPDYDAEETSLADQFRGDPGVHITASGRVVPRKCELCTALFVPESPLSHWKGSILPQKLRAPTLAAEILRQWDRKLPQNARTVLEDGSIPIRILWKGIRETATTIAAVEKNTHGQQTKLAAELDAAVRETASIKDPAERARKVKDLHTAYKEAMANSADSLKKFRESKRDDGNVCTAVLRYALAHFGECWKSPGSRTALVHTDTYAELRNKRTEWCDAGELRGDVIPDPNRDMTPCLPPETGV